MKWYEAIFNWKTLLALLIVFVVLSQGVSFDKIADKAAKVVDKVKVK